MSSLSGHKRKSDDHHHHHHHHGHGHHHSDDPAIARLEHEHEAMTKVKNIPKIIMGPFQVEAWYYSPFPDEYGTTKPLKVLYVCDYCLRYMRKKKTFDRHDCGRTLPPGRMIYNDNQLLVFEVDGKKEKVYCQNLCLLAKLFLDHKTLYYDPTPFYFYIVCCIQPPIPPEKKSHNATIVGFFSKEKHSSEDNNLACILTFPQFQNAGYGKFIISLSYEISKLEGKKGSPEKPLSDLGKISYRSYWTHVLFHLLLQDDEKRQLSIKDISDQTAIKMDDIISTMQNLNMIKHWKGQHVIHVQRDVISNYMKKRGKRLRLCKPEYLNWTQPPES